MFVRLEFCPRQDSLWFLGDLFLLWRGRAGLMRGADLSQLKQTKQTKQMLLSFVSAYDVKTHTAQATTRLQVVTSYGQPLRPSLKPWNFTYATITNENEMLNYIHLLAPRALFQSHSGHISLSSYSSSSSFSCFRIFFFLQISPAFCSSFFPLLPFELESMTLWSFQFVLFRKPLWNSCLFAKYSTPDIWVHIFVDVLNFIYNFSGFLNIIQRYQFCFWYVLSVSDVIHSQFRQTK